MAISPNNRPGSGGTNSTEQGRAGTSSGGDATSQPGQYPPGSFFGVSVPDGTGAPGTAGVNPGMADDPTIAPGQNTPSLGGETGRDVTQTGAPGSSGASANPAESGTSVTYTRPGSWLSGTYESDTYRQEIGGTRDDTQANDSGYGTGVAQLPGLQEPTSTGAGRGSVMRGGRNVR